MRLFLLIAHDKPEDGAIVGSKALLSLFPFLLDSDSHDSAEFCM